MKVTITNKDVEVLKKFMLLHSKMAKKQKITSFYLIPFEFILVGIVLDALTKLAPVLSITSAILGILWLVIFPRFYKKMLIRHLADSESLPASSVEIGFNVLNDEVIFGGEKESEKFGINELNRLVCTGSNFILAFGKNFHMVLPKNSQTAEILENLSQKTEIEIESIEIS